MIEKFNFYDVYGYFLPGAAFLAILWIPFGLVKNSWPSSTWSSAIIAAAFAYILGHLVQSIATNAIPSWEVKGPTGKNRYPSEIYLDSTDKELPEICKKKIQDLMKQQFGLELQVDKPGDDAIDKIRHNDFLLARQMLIQGKAVSYAEQFQGMYALTRGLVSVFALSTAYWLGWAATAVVRNHLTVGATILIMAGSFLVLMNISAVLLRNLTDPLKKRRIELGYAVVLLIAFLTIRIRAWCAVYGHSETGSAAGIYCHVVDHRVPSRLRRLQVFCRTVRGYRLARLPRLQRCGCHAA